MIMRERRVWISVGSHVADPRDRLEEDTRDDGKVDCKEDCELASVHGW